MAIEETAPRTDRLSSEEEHEENSMVQSDMTSIKLTKKKKEYLEKAIEDKSGVFNYNEDPNAYKKARK